MIQYRFPLLLTFAVAIAAYFSGATATLGAHPAWAGGTILLGAPLGLLLGYASTRLPYGRAIIGLAGLTIVSFAIAQLGKTQFAASYGENGFAGQMWFFGWHAVVVFAIATLFIAAANIRRG